MNAVTSINPQTTKSVTQWREPSLPDKLDALVDRKLSLSELPVVGPVSANELRAYVAACVPPRPQLGQIETMLAKLSLALPKAKVSQAEADERLDIYWQALRHHALPDLQQVFGVLVRTCQFFPTVAEIEAALRPIRAKRRSRLTRAELLIFKHEREWQAKGDPLTPEEARQLGSILANPLATDNQQQ